MLLPCCHVYYNNRYVNYSVKADVIAQWKMVNPLCESIMCCRCYCQVEDGKSTVRALCVAAVIARWRLKPTRVEVGRCYSQVADGIATVLF